jgi:hypothetical protein
MSQTNFQQKGTLSSMKSILMTLTLLSIAAIGACNSSSPTNKAASSQFADFANRATWDFTKQQRWKNINQFMGEQASDLIKSTQQAAIAHALREHWNVQQLQQYLNSIEQRRTGNLSATSCRVIQDVKKPYDYSACTQQQLTAEFFQEDEEIHGYK